jgi:hypothetical protein
VNETEVSRYSFSSSTGMRTSSFCSATLMMRTRVPAANGTLDDPPEKVS